MTQHLDWQAQVLQRMRARLGGQAAASPRTLLVFAHPDDETLAVGGRMETFRNARWLHITNGAARNGVDARAHGFGTLQEYRHARRQELHAVLRSAGIAEDHAEVLSVNSPGIDDRAVDAGKIHEREVDDQAAAFDLPALTRALALQIERHQPEAILTHPYEGGHPDHDSCAFAVHAAVRLVGVQPPVVLEAPFYHAGPEGITTGEFLRQNFTPEIAHVLSIAEQARKRERLAFFQTQQETLAQFRTERETMRVAPEYDFTQAPHPGRLFYEGFDWGVKGEQFRQLAFAALLELGLQDDAEKFSNTDLPHALQSS